MSRRDPHNPQPSVAGSPAAQSERRAAIRTARGVIAAVVAGYIVNTLLAVHSILHGAALAAFVACSAAAFVLQLAHSTRAPLTWPPRTRAITLSTQAAATLLPFAWVGPQAGALAGFLAGSLLLAVSGPWRWWLFGGVLLAVLLGQWAEGLTAVDIGYGVYFSTLTGLMIYAVSSLVSLVGMLYSARGEMAWMAVARERLRVARDLHDLLGLNLSAITLKGELAYRLLPMAVDRARQELADVLEVAHRALADMRVVAGGDQRMSMAAETETATAMLVSAGIRMTVESDLPELPETLDTVLAIVLREAVTNVLRHSKAERCVIESSVSDGQVRLLIRNDGVAEQSPTDGGSGLANLVGRLNAIGGRLTTARVDQWFELRATAPLPATEGPAPPAPGEPGAAAPAAGPWHRRAGRAITVLVLAGYGILMVVNVLPQDPPGLALLGFAACVSAAVALQVFVALHGPRRRRVGLRVAVVAAQALLIMAPLWWIGAPWGSMGGFVAGSALLLIGGGLRWLLYALVGAAVFVAAVSYGATVEWTAYLTLSTLLTGLVVFGISSLSGLVEQVDQARAELARAAVTRERLQVARQLRTRLGELLSAVSFRAQSAIRSLPAAPADARAEVAEMLDIARVAATNIRTVATGYRDMSLPAELKSAVTGLGSAGILTTVDVPDDQRPGEVDALFAVVLHEAVTNIIRHSAARTCQITIGQAGDRLRLLVTNDGTPDTAEPGAGLHDLAERLRAVGGDLTTEATNGTFRLLAELPDPGRVWKG
ncbi:sensor histidine kinase [Luedemannella helvata]|uniref:Signal transduction histidine kinase subgroup 3 dimerisation and phosphoacceptor domain-containing protein n=1 Tax=Luedemannella helvata TaxID=349315 RepID=A0ABP4VW91_9ACTN